MGATPQSTSAITTGGKPPIPSVYLPKRLWVYCTSSNCSGLEKSSGKEILRITYAPPYTTQPYTQWKHIQWKAMVPELVTFTWVKTKNKLYSHKYLEEWSTWKTECFASTQIGCIFRDSPKCSVVRYQWYASLRYHYDPINPFKLFHIKHFLLWCFILLGKQCYFILLWIEKKKTSKPQVNFLAKK